jgi:predicted alpha/beta superfamily hydrolase
MNYLKSFFAFFLFYFSLTFANAQTQFTKIEAPGSSGVKFKSTINGFEYLVYINCPEGFTKSGKKYPVIYTTDAQWSFTLFKDVHGGLLYDGLVPEAIIVGITWPSDYGSNRGRDLTPTHLDDVQNSGNATKFISVIKDEIMKYIEANYPIDNTNQTLHGTSLGGLFTLYTLFYQPDLFQRYIALSPSLGWDNQMIFQQEQKFAEKKLPLHKKLFLGSGGYEQEFNEGNFFDNFSNQLKEHNHKGLEVECVVLEKMGHGSISPVGISRGLQFVFSKPEIKLDTVVLDKYVGTYESPNGNFQLIRKDNRLYVSIRTMKISLYAEANERFYMKGLKNVIEFKKDEKGKVIGYQSVDSNDTTVSTIYKKLD